MDVLASVPAWVWQVLGVVCGLGAGVWMGLSQRRQGKKQRTSPPEGAASRYRPSELAPGPFVPAPAMAPAVPPKPAERAARAGAAPAKPEARARRAPEPAPEVPAEPPPVQRDPALERMLVNLQNQNAELVAKLRSTHDNHARDLLEQSQRWQAERQQLEQELTHTREEHSTELSKLMGLMVEQVDSLHQEYGQRIQGLEQQIAQLQSGLAEQRTVFDDAQHRSFAATELASPLLGGVGR